METLVDLGYKPRPWAARFHRECKRFSVLVVHRRGGKTVAALRQMIDRALRCQLHAPRYAYIAPEFTQAKKVSWEYLKDFTRAIPGVKFNESECWVELPNKARISISGANDPDRLRGIYLDGAVLDEVAQMNPIVWGEIIRPALSDRQGWAVFIGTPKGINLFSEMYYGASGRPDWYSAMFTVYDTNALPEAEIEDAKRSMSEAQFNQEFLCDFAAGNESALLSVTEVMEATRRAPREDAFSFASKIVGVDVARMGGDRSCIIRRQGVMCFQPQIYKGKQGFEIADLTARVIDEWAPDAVFVDDTGGYGGAVIERLKQLGHRIIGVQFAGKPSNDRYLNKRAEMWIEMAKWIKEGGALPDCQELRSDLCSPTYKHNANGKFQLESKEDMKKRGLPSPDCGDALSLTFSAPVSPRNFSFAKRPRASVPTSANGYSPFRRR